ncbi:antitoxin VbhA family protein [Amphritea sp.]|uniref:antitoxin VbhA family protein n=1 Tax=Amphritea sp. TaxID=1872502 RepID=UPI003D0FE22E
MTNCLRLASIDEVGVSTEFLSQLKHIGESIEWIKFRDNFCSPGTVLDHETKQGLGRLFCHLRGLPLISDDTVWLPQIAKRTGYIARYTVLHVLLGELELVDSWENYFLGSTFCLVDVEAEAKMSNWGIFWEDVIDFFEQYHLVCLPLCSNHQTASNLLDNVKANVSLSGLEVSDELANIASLAANGIITTEEALKRLGIII